MNSDITSFVITGCFWYWTTGRIAMMISPLREENRWHNRLAHLAFFLLTLLQTVALLWPVVWCHIAVSLTSAIAVLAVLISSQFDREGFWSKSRNQIVGGLTILAMGVALPVIVTDGTFIPTFFAIILAHGFQKAQMRQFATSLKDLDSIRIKVTRLQADLRNTRLEKQPRLPATAFKDAEPRDFKFTPPKAHLTAVSTTSAQS